MSIHSAIVKCSKMFRDETEAFCKKTHLSIHDTASFIDEQEPSIRISFDVPTKICFVSHEHGKRVQDGKRLTKLCKELGLKEDNFLTTEGIRVFSVV